MLNQESLIKLEQAFQVIFDPAVGQETRYNAQKFLDAIEAHPDGSATCWGLFLLLTARRDSAEIQHLDQIRLWCLRVIGHQIPSMTLADRQALLSGIWNEYVLKALDVSEPRFLTNRLVTVLVLICAIDYPASWPSAFTTLADRIAELHGKSLGVPGGDPAEWAATEDGRKLIHFVYSIFLQFLLQLDSEVVADEIASRSEAERNAAAVIKDAMRNGDIVLCINVLYRLLDGSLFALRPDEGPRPQWWEKIAVDSLKAVACICDWADTNLFLNPENKLLSFWQQAMVDRMFGTEVALASYDAYQALIHKKMLSHHKFLMFREFQVADLLIESLLPPGAVGTAYRTDAARLWTKQSNTLRILGLEALGVVKDLSGGTGSLDLSQGLSTESAGDTAASSPTTGMSSSSLIPASSASAAVPSEATVMLTFLWELLQRLIAAALGCFAPVGIPSEAVGVELEGAIAIGPFLDEFFRLLKAFVQRNRAPPSFDLNKFLSSAVEACVRRSRIPDSMDLTQFAEKEGLLDPTAVEEDDSEESLFVNARVSARRLMRKLFAVLWRSESLVVDFQQLVQLLITQQTPAAIDWRSVECGLTSQCNAFDGYKEIPGASVTDPKLIAYLDIVLPLVLEGAKLTAVTGCPRVCRLTFFELLGKLCLFFKQGLKPQRVSRDDIFVAGISSLLGPGGLRARDSIVTTTVATRELLRFTKAFTGTAGPPGAVVALVVQLGTEGFLTVSPLPEAVLPPQTSGVNESEAIPKYMTEVVLPDFPQLTAEGQLRLFEFVGLLSLQPADKQLLLESVVPRTLNDLNATADGEKDASGASVSERVMQDWVNRALRCMANFLKGYSVLSGATSTVESLTQALLFAAQRYGHVGAIQHNLLVLARRLLNSCTVEEASNCIRALVKRVSCALMDSVKQTGPELRYRLYGQINSASQFVSAIASAWSDRGVAAVLMRDPDVDRPTLLHWYMDNLLTSWQFVSGTTGMTPEAQESLQTIFAVIQTVLAKAPVAAAAIMLTAEDDENSVVKFLTQGIEAGIQNGRAAPMTANNILFYSTFLASAVTDPHFASRLVEIVASFGLDGNIAGRFTARHTIKIAMIARVAFEKILQLQDYQDPQTVKMLQEFGILIRLVWTGKLFGAKIPLVSNTLLLQACQTELQSAFQSEQEIFKAFAQAVSMAESPKQAREITSQWFGRLRNNSG